MSAVTRNRGTSLRTIAADCLILAIPTVVMSNNVESGIATGLVSALVLIVLTPLKTDTNMRMVAAAMLAVTFATLASTRMVVTQPNDNWSADGSFCLLIVFNVVMLGHSLSRSPGRDVLHRVLCASRICAFFLASLAFLISVKVLLGTGLSDGSLSALEPLQLTILLYPGGVFLVAGLTGALLREDKAHT
ncbi:MAG: hypothetical protein QF473_17540 [Planctomycetota bacterium]|jgi:Na+-translocating ferredoxin:NAD+ oxidoreductase RnfE subunit|nr:hypothetical protein [Planctomycetota bacterium]